MPGNTDEKKEYSEWDGAHYQVLDAFPDQRANRMVLYLRGRRGTERLRFRWLPEFYIHSPGGDLERARRFFCHNALYECETTTRALRLGSAKQYPVLSVRPATLGLHLRAARAADFFGGFGRFRFYNLDIDPGQRFLLEMGLFPLARLRVPGNRPSAQSARRCGHPGWEVVDNRLSVHYPVPRLRTARLSVAVKRPGILPSFDDRLEAASLSGRTFSGDEEDILSELANELQKLDTDVILTEGGDQFVLPYLYHRAALAGLGCFCLGRERQPVRPQRKEKSYFTYGRILHRPAAYHLRGRLHIDTCSSFLYQEGDMEGIIDMSRLSGIPVQRMARCSPGTAISAMEVNHVLRSGGMVAWKKNLPEDFKSLRRLLSADRGGFIYEPAVGVHGRVLEVDFASMYPHIMVNSNISPETMNCRCCRPKKVEPGQRERGESSRERPPLSHLQTAGEPVPVIGHWTCRNRRGLIPVILEPLVRRRMEFKHLKKKTGDRWDLRARCLKPLLVTCFGYTGYRNAPFGRIECHEAINAHGRDILLESARTAENYGFRVLHGIVDSMWLKGPMEKRVAMIRDIARRTRVPLSEEGIYRWIVFLPDKLTGAGALNRYFGLFETGEFKLRGIALRRHDTPQLVRALQKDMLSVLAGAGDELEFVRNLPAALESVRSHALRVLDGKCGPGELVLTRRVSRTLDEYAQLNETYSALRKLDAAGVTVPPGEVVRYILVETDNGKLEGAPVQTLTGSERYDRRAYFRMVVRGASELLAPFGYDERRMENILKGGDARQTEL